MAGFAVKYFMFILALSPTGEPIEGTLHELPEVKSMQECQMQLPDFDQKLPDGRRIYFRCVVQGGA